VRAPVALGNVVGEGHHLLLVSLHPLQGDLDVDFDLAFGGFRAHDALEIERHLAALREAGLQAEDVEIRKADLEDVFIEVMAGKGRSAAAPGQAS
jgi:hypothetical protein